MDAIYQVSGMTKIKNDNLTQEMQLENADVAK